METRSQQIERIVREESAKFLDEQFGSLDLSGCPSTWKPLPEEASLPDDRFAPLDDRGRGLGSNALKRGLQQLAYDPEVAEQLAREGHGELLKEYQQDQAGKVAQEFRRLNREYYKCPQNYERLISCLAYNFLNIDPDDIDDIEQVERELIRRGHFTLSNLTAAYKALARAGSLEMRPGLPRTLNQHQLRVIGLEAANDVEVAIARYLQARLPEEIAAELTDVFDIGEVLDRLADPELARVVDEGVWYCWEHGRANYSPTTERRRFLQQYIADRIPTVALLDQAWLACQAAEKDAARAGILRQFEAEEARPAAPDLDRMTDEQIDALYHSTLKQVARDSRRRQQ